MHVLAQMEAMRLDDLSAVSALRFAAARRAVELGFKLARRGELELLVTEAASNALLHGGGGQAVLGIRDNHVVVGVVDSGPGMANVQRCMRDGYSTRGTAGHGLGSIKRLASRVEITSFTGRGTVVLAEVGPQSSVIPTSSAPLGAVLRPLRGESVSGDIIAYRRHENGRMDLMVFDGLGHGPPAHRVAQTAVSAFDLAPERGPVAIVEYLHHALRGSRGGVVGVACFDAARSHVDAVLLGNVDALVVGGDKTYRFAANNGVLGSTMRTLEVHGCDLRPGEVFVMHSDGLRRIREPSIFPGLVARSPLTIATLLYRDHERRTDDASVAVVRPEVDDD